MSGVWHGFVVKNRHEKDTCDNEIELCTQKEEIVSSSSIKITRRACVIA